MHNNLIIGKLQQLVILGLLLSMIWNVKKNMLQRESVATIFFSINQTLLRALAVSIGLNYYEPALQTFDLGINELSSFVSVKEFDDTADKLFEEKNEKEPMGMMGIYNMIADFAGGSSIFRWVSMAGVLLSTKGLVFFLLFFRSLSLVILSGLGVYACALLAWPGLFEKAFSRWLGMFVTLEFWAVIFALLERLIICAAYAEDRGVAWRGAVEGRSLLADMLTFIVHIFMFFSVFLVPKWSAKLFGAGADHLGGFMQSAVNMAVKVKTKGVEKKKKK